MKKNILLIVSAILVAVLLLHGVRFQSVDEYYLEHSEDIKPGSPTVTMSIRCDTVLKNYERLDKSLQSEKYVPKNGEILKSTQYVLREGDTVFDILSRAVRRNHIQMEYQGADKNQYGTVYIEGINYIYEFSCGPLSGWMFLVNGEAENKGCSAVTLKNGDVIEWVYTCDLGRDLGIKQNF